MTELKQGFLDVKKSFESISSPKAGLIPKEKMDFFLTQMDSINSRLESLERVIEIGVPLQEAESSMKRLTTIEQSIQENNSKMSLLAATINDLTRETEVIKKELQAGVSNKVIQNMETRVEVLQNVVKQYSGSNTHEILVELVEIVQSMDKHISAIENFINKDLQKDIVPATGNVVAEVAPKPVAPTAVATQPRRIPTGIRGFFSRLFRKKS
ncbi:MAG: hypothetical protein V1777_04065 [Candidatus Micrarchaeota archaeon]